MATAPTTTAGPDLTSLGYWDALNRKSVSRFFLLTALRRKPQHGYELRKSIADCCPGAEPTDAMIYPTLKLLVDGGYVATEVESIGARTRNVCRLTAKGEEAFNAAARAWAVMLPHLQKAVDGDC